MEHVRSSAPELSTVPDIPGRLMQISSFDFLNGVEIITPSAKTFILQMETMLCVKLLGDPHW